MDTDTQPSRLGRILLTVSLVLSALVSIAVDLNETHLFNPDWHPHAVFHDVAMLNLLAGMTIFALWLLWRRYDNDPALASGFALFLPVIFWSVFFWGPVLVSEASLFAVEDELALHVGDLHIAPNIVVALVMLAISIAGFVLDRRARTASLI